MTQEAIEQAQEGMEPETNNAEVIELDASNFAGLVIDADSGTVISDNPWFIKFYAPWCRHCQVLAPIFEQMSFKHHDRLNMGGVDCTADEGKKLCEMFNVQGYPTLVYMEGHGDVYYKYNVSGRGIRQLEGFAIDGGYKNAPSVPIGQHLTLFQEIIAPYSQAIMNALKTNILQ